MAEQRNNPHRHRAAHARAPGPPLPGVPARPGPADPGRAGPGWPYPDTGQPDWPAGAGGADWPPPGADYPSWPADAGQSGWVPGADHPSWPAGAAGPDWPQPGTDYSSWPADTGYDWFPDQGGTSGPRREQAVVQHHEQGWQTPAPVPATRYEYPYPARPTGDAHATTQRWSAQLARTQDTATQTYYELAFGDGRLQVMLTEPPAASQEWAAGVHARPVEVLPAVADQAGALGWDAVDLRNADAARILSDADQQAAGIHREAAAQATAIREAAEQEAAEIRQQAAAQAVPVRETAEQEAAEIRQQAAGQATAVREAAEREAAAIRAAAQRDAEALRSAVETMSAELGRMTSVLDDTLTGLRAVPRGGAPQAGMSAGTATTPAAPPQEAESAGSTAPAGYPDAGGYTAPDARPQRAAGRPAARPGHRSPDGPGAAPDDVAGPEGAPSPSGYAAPGEHGAKTAPPSALRKPPGKSGTQTRQHTAARRVAIGAASLVTFGLLLGAFNLFTYHSLSFFVFRGQGVGATPPSPLPAQPNATPSPVTHHHSAASGHKLPEPKGRHHRRKAHDQSAHGGNHG